ncbi:acetyl esterase/lipase [Mucilaginibacter yixingensis]|uniref:Acetyl esterase/lipase n=1 Tax=Mucilaginibacter yixingensis TaxID=1295612 RepID=A0A2T5J600_9SPHI|nr:alpha/beta hydrolase [Mucilaginibacter yixingensis]PTQ93963.1 acetyl esterase/lipase [Mucilaginibacter yixingensis]
MKRNIRLILLAQLITFTTVKAQTTFNLYKDVIPGSKPVKNEEVSETEGGILRISKITVPTLTAYIPEKQDAKRTAVIICPGGGYQIVAADHEGAAIAKEFNKKGITAFVLKYRLPNEHTMQHKEIGPLQDAQQAIKTVRDSAAKWNIDPARVGIMGFSAGGHLASTAGTHFTKPVIDNKENTNLRPDFMILIYPVISFQDVYGHVGSREQLIGKNPSQEKIKEYSNELQVTSETPTTFLVHASDDNVVHPLNSILFYQALLANHIPAELHLYQTGGHGFGRYRQNTADEWLDRCFDWMTLNGWRSN